jgi:hypothetical protein
VGLIFAGLIILGEGWVGLSVAGADLAVAVSPVVRLDRTADADYIGTLIGVLMRALLVLILASWFSPDSTLIEFCQDEKCLRS